MGGARGKLRGSCLSNYLISAFLIRRFDREGSPRMRAGKDKSGNVIQEYPNLVLAKLISKDIYIYIYIYNIHIHTYDSPGTSQILKSVCLGILVSDLEKKIRVLS